MIKLRDNQLIPGADEFEDRDQDVLAGCGRLYPYDLTAGGFQVGDLPMAGHVPLPGIANLQHPDRQPKGPASAGLQGPKSHRQSQAAGD